MRQTAFFYNPVGSNDATASRVGAPGVRFKPQERFCMLGWHWVYDYPHDSRDAVVQSFIEMPMGRTVCVQACQKCMRRWYETGRAHVGTLTNGGVFWPSDFRPRHLRRIERWLRNKAPLLRDEKANNVIMQPANAKGDASAS